MPGIDIVAIAENSERSHRSHSAYYGGFQQILMA
jgi:hypothetical protein